MTPVFFSTKVVGVTFHEEYPHNFLRLVEDIVVYGEVPARLERELGNPFDANSIRVKVEGEHVGYLPRLISAVLAPEMDSGRQWYAKVESVLISEGNVDQPGLKLIVWRNDEVQ